MNSRATRIVHGVRGPTGESGVLMVVPPSEALDWDLQAEVASTGRYWIAERQAWWVAAPYASTAVSIATRFNGGRPPLEEFAAATTNGGPGRGENAGQAPQRRLRRLWERVHRLVATLRVRARKGARER